MSNEANEPAYPYTFWDCDITGETLPRCTFPGLTKRERFAMAAMQGLLASPGVLRNSPEPMNRLADIQAHYANVSVGYADALLAALESGEKA